MMKRIKNQGVKAKKQPRYTINREKFFSPEQQEQLISYVKKRSRDDLIAHRRTWVIRYALVRLALYSGLRVSEISKLEVKDCYLDVDGPYLRIRNSKGGNSRDVYIDDTLVEDLLHHIQFLSPKQAPAPSLRLFDRTTTALNLAFREALIAADLPVGSGKPGSPGYTEGFSIHSARHTYATMLLHRTNNNIKYVQKQLGHSHMNMTSLYSDILPEENSKLANMILNTNQTK